MPLINPPIEGSAIKYKYVNPDIPSGNTVSSSLTANPKTAFNSSALIPESTAVIGGIAGIECSGVITSGVTALSLTLTIEMAGIVVATLQQPVSANLTNAGWCMNITAIILANGTVEVQGTGMLGLVTASIKNTASFTMSITGGVPVTVSAQWGVLALGGSISLRQMIVQVT